jgi:CRISPR-associated protein Cas2
MAGKAGAMSEKQFVVVVYDISHDRRRSRLHNALLDFGNPVQYSVFECWLTAWQAGQMQARIREVIRPRKEHVRWYFLCRTCAARVQTTHAGEITKTEGAIIA